jgi:hypothetical protein
MKNKNEKKSPKKRTFSIWSIVELIITIVKKIIPPKK